MDSTVEFDDLNDEIGADDWLIPREEITRRRLIKETHRYKIYKADWFGDVLVYEPVKRQIRSKHKIGEQQDLATRRQHQQTKSMQINQDELNSRFNELNLNLNSSKSWWNQAANSSQLSPSLSCNSDQIDSAYSSISSTPQYHTKHIKSEFEFPSSSSSLSSSSTSTLSSSLRSSEFSWTPSLGSLASTENSGNFIESCRAVPVSCLHQERMCSSEHNQQPGNFKMLPVVLNKDSFGFGYSRMTAAQSFLDENNNENCNSNNETLDNESEIWFELNELRLVAHENFMLFMGASMDMSLGHGDQYASLVMQMSHPKATSLFNLLHANNLSTVSPIDRFRFFASSSNKQRQQLNLGAKLNICQQVTNAMTYLHDKNIVHGRLTSINIYIELNQRVKISLIDNDEQSIATTFKAPVSHQTGAARSSVSFNLPALTYLSPEIIKTIKIREHKKKYINNCDNDHQTEEAQVRIDTSRLTKKSDVFSFGTLLFELFQERFPFSEMDSPNEINSERTISYNPFLAYASHSLLTPTTARQSPFVTTTKKNWNGNIRTSASELIFQIGSGQIEKRNQTKSKKCPALVDYIISACWSSEPSCRPQFKQLAFA